MSRAANTTRARARQGGWGDVGQKPAGAVSAAWVGHQTKNCALEEASECVFVQSPAKARVGAAKVGVQNGGGGSVSRRHCALSHNNREDGTFGSAAHFTAMAFFYQSAQGGGKPSLSLSLCLLLHTHACARQQQQGGRVRERTHTTQQTAARATERCVCVRLSAAAPIISIGISLSGAARRRKKQQKYFDYC